MCPYCFLFAFYLDAYISSSFPQGSSKAFMIMATISLILNYVWIRFILISPGEWQVTSMVTFFSLLFYLEDFSTLPFLVGFVFRLFPLMVTIPEVRCNIYYSPHLNIMGRFPIFLGVIYVQARPFAQKLWYPHIL